MSSYKTYLISVFCIIFFTACSVNSQPTLETKKDFKKVEVKDFAFENETIIYALEAEHFKDYTSAREIYKELFKRTNNYEYYVKYINYSFYLKDFSSINNSFNKYYLEDIKQEEEILKWHAYSLSALKKNDQAIKWAKVLLEKYENPLSYEILARVYYDAKEYENAYSNFKISNDLEESITKISILANIKYNFLNKKSESIEFLKQNINLKEYDYTLSLQLLTYYGKSREFDNLTDFLKNMYLYYDKKSKKRLLESTKKLFVSYSFRLKDVNSLIDFLEKYEKDDFTLFALYEKANKKQKAYEFLNKAYEKDKNTNYLAQIAVLEFEMASDKKLVLNSVIKKLSEALKTSTQAKYQNYLAYLLIDYDIDFIKGLSLVKKALKQEPENLAYLDTLAWGEYKVRNCKEAYTIMEKIVKQTGLEDEEIKLHWEKIKECNK